jgi:hypothetical protein
MVVLQDGSAFDINPDDLKAYLRAVADGKSVALEQYSVEAGEYLGDFTELSPALARVLQGALSADVLGQSSAGDLALLLQFTGIPRVGQGGEARRSDLSPVAA